MRILVLLALIDCTSPFSVKEKEFVYILTSEEVIDPLIIADGDTIKADIYTGVDNNDWTSRSYTITGAIKFKYEITFAAESTEESHLYLAIDNTRVYKKIRLIHLYNKRIN